MPNMWEMSLISMWITMWKKSFTFYLLMASADNLCKQFRLRSGLTKCLARSGSKTVWHSDSIPERILGKVDFEKNQMTKSWKNFPVGTFAVQSIFFHQMTSLWDLGIYLVCKQWRLGQACRNGQFFQSLSCTHTQRRFLDKLTSRS